MSQNARRSPHCAYTRTATTRQAVGHHEKATVKSSVVPAFSQPTNRLLDVGRFCDAMRAITGPPCMVSRRSNTSKRPPIKRRPNPLLRDRGAFGRARLCRTRGVQCRVPPYQAIVKYIASCHVSAIGGVLRAGPVERLGDTMTEQRTHVVVIGGGYSGTLAANHLRMRTDVDISLVNPRPTFVERIRLHQLVAGTGDPTVDYGTLLGEGVHLVVDSATRINTAARQVQLASGDALGLRLRHLCGRHHRHDTVLSPWRRRIRLSHCRIRVCAAAALRPRRAAPGGCGQRRRRRAHRDRDGRRTHRAGPHGHAGLRRPAGPITV